ncbi:OmpA family protein [Maritimibacter dapengensis]|uniref:OmpA family protein n=1 Tax=Maritimibacter dapengensis TaxID=2836868 RepID=A0ABS6SXX1_9RHOB|nr:OmpA family protein [Maritimibacter dapengensis]MBV7377812.1 OmpA family protein [Maritimibacter dapengensis]
MTLMKPILILPLVGALTLSACDTMGSRERAGVATGAVAGGLLGAAIPGNRGATAAIGAAGGAVVGGIVGSQLDRQAGELRQNFGNDRIQVINTGTALKVVMPQDILFATDSATVSPGLTGDLRVLAAHLRKYPGSRVRVIGHTDNTGDAGYNLQLSERRAQAVTAALVSNGVGGTRVVSVGRGDSQPVATNLTPEGRAQNRRVEIIIDPNN